MSDMAHHILRRALRSLWENLYLNLVAAGVIAASLLLIGVYLTIQYNLNAMVDTWSQDVHVSAYFSPDTDEPRRFALRDAIALQPEVAAVRYVSEEDAREWLVARVEGLDDVLDELGPQALPSSLEITLQPQAAQPADIARFAVLLSEDAKFQGGFSDIDYGREWVERFNAFLALMKAMGIILGLLILIAAAFLVANTIHLVVYSRRDELLITRLVGASNAFITTPFLLEGLVQGLLGALGALCGLWVVHQVLVMRLQDMLQLNLAGEFRFLPLSYFGLLAASGAILGVASAWITVSRFLARAP